MDVIPAIRTPHDVLVRLSDPEIRKLRDLPYEQYLLSDWWKRRRNLSLQLAGWRCSRCDSRRDLQVHHTTYANRGCELDGDLQVVCRTCHEGHHFKESRTKHLGIYIRVVSSLVAGGEQFQSLSDLTEAAKVACARAQIPYDGHRVSDAIQLVQANRKGILVPAWGPRPANETAEPGPAYIGTAEVLAILKRLGIQVAVRTIPNVKPRTLQQTAQLRAADMVAKEILESIQRCEELERQVGEPA